MKFLITGGCGFIGSNSADYFLKKGHEVTVLDNMSRKGVEKNLDWLRKNHPKIKFVKADIRYDQSILNKEVEGKDVVLHFAGQTAVTTSVINPRKDFEINAIGTFNVLEAIRNSKTKPMILESSTNKVYGGMKDVKVHEVKGRYEYVDFPKGIPENALLDFHSPYGCSKGCAEQYVIDYGRIYGLRTVVFRQSCIYGYRQFGVEDQGWVAWFTIATLFNKPLTVYGDGKQTRDVLFVEDLIRAYEMAIENIDKTSGKAYNIGGGSENQMSLLELVKYLETEFNKKLTIRFNQWRPGDQPVFVCDITKAKKDFGWEPKINVRKGIQKLSEWVKQNKELFSGLY
ncbi:TPA: NAD-dependent epimerase/dehydratase family protein [Candidatus Woesearchaeota archaeon]|nr:GDP-mannose 4,6-dehydratase [Candidatus Woesearchaeota archaeon]HIH39502.1 NAD-dependent epimerase/dehydratase family protein [Candidatus Woesearchaeota archaeon]